MTTEKEQLEAEIAKRDARIAELEEESMQDTKVINDLLASIHELKAQQLSAGVVDDRAAFDEWFNDFSLSVRMNGGQMNDAQMFAAWQARARLDQPTASASVVVGALVSALEGIVHDERVPNEVSQDYAALLIEARRLNPCRAQAVPDDEELKLLRAFYQCCASITDQLADSPKSAFARLVEAVKDAAPSAKKESGQ